MKRILLLLLLQVSAIACFADEYKDPATNVIYTYDPAGNSAEVKKGRVVYDDYGELYSMNVPGSPDAKAEIVILDKFSVDGKEYVVDKIGDYAFASMRKIMSVVVPSSVKSIGYCTFGGCSLLSDVVLSEGLNSIEKYAFMGCGSITNMLLPEGLEAIEPYAFSGCTNLKAIYFPTSLKRICPGTFWNCFALSEIYVASGNPYYDSRNNCNAIIETASDKLIIGCKGTQIPATIRSIGNSAFISCPELESIDVPESVVEIGDSAFYHCINLKQISLSEGLKTIRRKAFYDTWIPTVTIPSTVQAIELYAFYCPALTTMTSLIEEPFEVNYMCHPNQQRQITLRVPSGTKSKYQATPGWQNFRTIEEIQPTGITPPLGETEDEGIYDLGGRKMVNDKLPRGIYIENGKKKVK